MKNQTLAASSFYKQKYYFNEMFHELPTNIQDEIKIMCNLNAEKSRGIFTVGFHENGEIIIKIQNEENDYDFDEIGAELLINEIRSEYSQLFQSLSMYYVLYHTAEGNKILENARDQSTS